MHLASGSIFQNTNTNRQKLEIDSDTIAVGDFNIPLSSLDRPSKIKINKTLKAQNG